MQKRWNGMYHPHTSEVQRKFDELNEKQKEVNILVAELNRLIQDQPIAAYDSFIGPTSTADSCVLSKGNWYIKDKTGVICHPDLTRFIG